MYWSPAAAGYIGSHTCVELLNSGYGVVVVDNLCNANPKSLDRVRELTGKDLRFYEGDVRDEGLLRKIFAENEHRLRHPLRRAEGRGRKRRKALGIL